MSRPVVADASALVEHIAAPKQESALDAVLADPSILVALPHLCDVEVASAVQKLVRRGLRTVADAKESLHLYRNLPLERCDHVPLLGRVFELRDNFSAYDAAYVALAEALDAPLVTADRRLAEAVRRFTRVEVGAL